MATERRLSIGHTFLVSKCQVMICRAMTEGHRTRVLILAGVVIEINSSCVAYLSSISCCWTISDIVLRHLGPWLFYCNDRRIQI